MKKTEVKAPDLETGYSVEFFDMLGNTVATATLSASALRWPTAAVVRSCGKLLRGQYSKPRPETQLIKR